MSTSPGPNVRRRQLGAALRKLRQEAGYGLKDAADWLGVGDPAVSKVENAKTSVKPGTIRALGQLYDIDASKVDYLIRLANEANQRGWWTSYRETVPEWFRMFVGLEGDACDIWEYESEFVPGLLQTTGYADSMVRASRPDIDDAALEGVLTVRRERQARLDDNHPPRLHYYLNEAVIRRVVGGPEVMGEQLESLVNASAQDHMTIRLVPFAAGAYAAMAAPFAMMQFPDEDAPAFAYLENDRGAIYQEDPGDVARYRYMIDQLDMVALDTDATRAELKRVASEHERTHL